MLRIIQNRSAEGAKSYYSRAEYYGEGQEKAGKWGGKAAESLGLAGQIAEKDFQSMCDNLNPLNGSQLTARHNADRTVGYDFNWHVPKGVSLAYAVGGDTRIEEVFERSVNETMEEIEQEAKTRVRLGGQQGNRVTGNLAWGQFVHVTARPDDKGEVDPHLHAHCFVFNITHDPEEKRFKAVQFRDLKRDARFFEAKMHARLAKYLKDELGYSIKRDGRSWDIAGIDVSLKNKFSRRTTEIEKIAEEEGITSPEDKSQLGARTRNSKSNQESFSSLQDEWKSRMEADEVVMLNSAMKDPSGAVENGPQSEIEATEQAIMHCFERESVVTERKVLEEAMRMGVGIVDVDNVRDIAQGLGLIVREIDGRRLATIPAALKDEAIVLDFAIESLDSVSPLNSDWMPKVDWLSQEQDDAISQLVKSGDKLQLLLGGAGTGKTTLMRHAVDAIRDGGHQVFAFAPSAEASRNVLREEGFKDATTVAELLVNEKLQDKTHGQVIWIDEASLLGTRQLKQVVDLVDRVGARLILSGDWKRQHGSVERGGVLGLLDRYSGVTPIQINTIRRQEGKYKEAIAVMASGDIAAGLNRLDKMGWVHELDDDARDIQIASDYADVVTKGKSALVVSPTHREAAHLTDAIRMVLRSQGMITGEDHEVRTLTPIHLTDGERSDSAFYQDGDVIVFHKNARGFTKSKRLEVNGAVPDNVTSQSDRFSVYRPSSIQLASGDKVRITSGGKTKDGEHRLNNGGVFDVAEVEPSGDIKLANGWTIDKDFGHLANGFVTTSHASQGRTVDHVFIAESSESFPAASMEQLYVSASRGRKSAHIYTDSKTDLRGAVQDSSQKHTATELFARWRQYEDYKRQRKAASKAQNVEKQQNHELAYEQ